MFYPHFTIEDKVMLTKYRQESFKTNVYNKYIIITMVLLIILIPLIALASETSTVLYKHTSERPKLKQYDTIKAYVTGYNTVPEQTDSTPCIAASGENICGRVDVITCPRKYAFYTVFEIDTKLYTCLDRTALKYDDRFDISCDKDINCPARVTGYKLIKIIKNNFYNQNEKK